MLMTYLVTAGINLAALIFLAVLLNRSTGMNHPRRKPFLVGITLTVGVILAEAGTLIAQDGGSAWRTLNLVSNVVGFMLTPLIPLVLAAIFDRSMLRRHTWLVFPAGLNAAAALVSPWFGLLFSIDSDNQYQRGSLFGLFIAAYGIHVVFLAVVTLRSTRKSFHPIQGRVIGLLLFTIAGTAVQLVYPSVLVSWHCVSLALILYYLILMDFDNNLDTVTGLFNRAAYEEAISRLTGHGQLAVIIMDINDFKTVNDTHGHDYGDAALRIVAAIIRDAFDGSCCVYRIGGDEFCVICRHADPAKIEQQIRRMVESLTRERQKDSRLPTLSYGFSASRNGMQRDFQQILKQADEQMYIYKQKAQSDAATGPR
ncbi:MAG: GGDEF domain-containing protein [Clostridiaceae bacterium]|jgi:diguanylate cyclase (GGDEF)-like protein|nr:GGDEF domain-containing protein [Clostridiaceae bacterium]